jgi:hypothetical protein
MSPKSKKNVFVFLILIFFIFSPSFSIKLPTKAKILEYNHSINNNIRSLAQKELEITNYKYYLMETELCVGTPEQCFKVLYDTGTVYLILGVDNTNLKFKKGFNSLMSDTFMQSENRFFAVPFKSSVLVAREVRDKVSIIPSYNLPYLFSFLLAWNSTESYDYEGILGLGYYYPKRDFDNSFDERFSFVHYLKSNGIINNLIFGHEYVDRTKGILYFGEEPKSMQNGYFKCKVQNFISYNNKWHCPLLSVYYTNIGDYLSLGSTAAFDTGYTYIKGPYYQVYTILDKLLELSEGKCELVQQQIEEGDDYGLIRLICDENVDTSKFSNIDFDIVGFRITLLKSDLLRKMVTKDGKMKYEVTLIGDSTYKFWNFGEPILKNYDMVFNYEDNTVGFKENNNLIGGDWNNVFVLSVVFVIFLSVAIYIYKNRKNIFRKNVKEEDIQKFQETEMKQGLQMTDI